MERGTGSVLIHKVRWRFSGGRDSETGSSGGTHVAPSERWRSGWDHEFEISFAPAASLQTLGPSAQQHVSRRVVECRCGGGTYLFGTRIAGEQRGGRSGNPRARTYRYRWHACSPGHPLNGQSFTMLGMRSAPIGRSVYRSDRRFLRTPRGIHHQPYRDGHPSIGIAARRLKNQRVDRARLAHAA